MGVAMLALACTAPNPAYMVGDSGALPGDAATGGTGGVGPDGATGGSDATDVSTRDTSPAATDVGVYSVVATLVGHWPFDEGAGTTVADYQGSHDATLAGGVSWLQGGAPTPSPNPACLAFDGSDDEGQATVTEVSGLDQPFSLAVWVWSPQPSGNPRKTILTLLRPPSAEVGGGVQMGIQGLSPALWYYGDDGLTNTLVFPSTITAQAWHHLAYVHENGRHTLYVDGVMMASAERAPPTSEAPTRLRIATYGGASQHFPGRLDDLRLYRGALTSAEVAALVASPP
jgi:hypothetical protein